MATEIITVKTIISMLSSTHKGIQLSELDIANWCGECIEEIGEYTAMERFRNVKLTIENNIAELPCNVFRVLHIKDGSVTPAYDIAGPYVKFQKYSGTVTMDYLGIPTAKDGYPLIDRKARQACYWYCLKRLKMEDYEAGKIAQGIWQEYSDNEEYYIAKARGNMGNVTRDDLNKMTRIMYSMVSQVTMPHTLD